MHAIKEVMMKRRTMLQKVFLLLSTGAVLAALLLFLVGCSDSAIFYIIANTTKIIDNSLDNKATVLALVHDDSVTNSYYASIGGSMWKRSDTPGAGQWQEVTMPSGTAICTALTFFTDNKLYAGFIHGDDSFSFQSADPALSPTWAKITDPLIDGKQITKLSVAGGSIFLFTWESSTDTYNAISYDGAVTFLDAGCGDQVGNPIVGVVYDTTAPRFVLATESNIYYGNSASTISTEPAANPPSSASPFTGILYYDDGTDNFFLASENGIVQYADAPDPAAAWTASPQQKITTTGSPVPFSALGIVGTNVMIGSIGYGFYEMPYDDMTKIARSQDVITASELYNGWVSGFLVNPGPPDEVFILTAGSGLWSRNYDAGAWQGDNWIHE
jgi:hypothetical protein